MLRQRILTWVAMVVLLAASMTTMAVPVFAHDWAATCGGIGTSTGLLYVFENDPAGGDEEDACHPSDDNWGCCTGSSAIQTLNNQMSRYHMTDRAGDGQRFCVRFFDGTNFSGAQKLANGGVSLTNGQHVNQAAPGGWDDRVSSHQQYGVGGASC